MSTPRGRVRMETGRRNNRLLSCLLKSCNALEKTCKLGTAATQYFVGYLEESQRVPGKSVQKAVSLTLLRHSTSTSRVAKGLSDELISFLRVPRMVVERYEVRQLHFLVALSLMLSSELDIYFLWLTGTSYRRARAPSWNTPDYNCEG